MSPTASVSSEDLKRSIFLAAILIQALILIHHAADYFFVFDDYALIYLGDFHTVENHLKYPHIGFYRPLIFLLFKLNMWLVDWQPWVYPLQSALIHGANAFLVGYLAREEQTLQGLMAGALFFISPWASETFFWVSSHFDLVATTGILLGLIGLQKALVAKDMKKPLLLAIPAIFLAPFSKEIAVTIPALFALLTLQKMDVKALLSNGRFWGLSALSGILIVIYLYIRHRQIGVLGGAYGNYTDMLQNAAPFKLVHPFLLLPNLPGAEGLSYVFALLGLILVIRALVLNPRGSGLLILTIAVALLPVISFSVTKFGSGNTRFLYLPGVFVAMLFAQGLKPSLESRRFDVPQAVMCGALTMLMIISVLTQKTMWHTGMARSRQCIEQFGEVRDKSKHFKLENLPGGYFEGGHMLKPYAFYYYYDGKGIEGKKMRIEAQAQYFHYGYGEPALERHEEYIGKFYEEDESVIPYTLTFSW